MLMKCHRRLDGLQAGPVDRRRRQRVRAESQQLPSGGNGGVQQLLQAVRHPAQAVLEPRAAALALEPVAQGVVEQHREKVLGQA